MATIKKSVSDKIQNDLVESLISEGIDHFGYYVINARGNVERQDFNYAYTIGLLSQALPEILLVINAGEATVAAIMAEAVEKLRDTVGDFNIVFELPSCVIDGAPGRFKWMRLDTKSAKVVLKDFMQYVASRYAGTAINPRGIYQLLGPDGNNRLPGEIGYDRKFTQPIFIVK